MSGCVQVFGRRNDEAIHALCRPASKKRQGRKSRSVVLRRCSVRYGDFATRAGVRSLAWSDWGDGFGAKHGCASGCERAAGALHDKIFDVTAGELSDPLRAWMLPAASQQE